MGLYNAVLMPPADLSARITDYAQAQFKDAADGYCLSDISLPHITLCQFKTHGAVPAFTGFPGFSGPFDAQLSGYGAHYGYGVHKSYTWVELLVHKTGPLVALQKAVSNYLSGHNIKPMTKVGDYYTPHVTLARVATDDYKALPNFVPPESLFEKAQAWIFVCGKSDKNGQFWERCKHDRKLVIATHNKGKLKEFQAMLGGFVHEVKSAGELGLIEPEETGATFIENATMKAVTAMKACGLPCLSDDSGLCVNALDGAPGVYSADWAGNPRDFQKAMASVHEKMGDAADKSAYFTSVLVLAYPDGRIETFEGRVNGEIVWPPRGEKGFGYDPMFQPEGYGLTFGEIDPAEKDKISHRARAVEKLAQYFKLQTSQS